MNMYIYTHTYNMYLKLTNISAMKGSLLSSSSSIFTKVHPNISYSGCGSHREMVPFPSRKRCHATVAAVVPRREKVVVIMGPTGCGKTKLSIDLASDTSLSPSSEIINSDKIQAYRGLDITTNKVPLAQRKNVRHHLLGDFDPSPEFTPSDFRSAASALISGSAARRSLPFVVGGSNSFVHALLAEEFDPEADVFRSESPELFCRGGDLRYDCCFLWVDVSFPVLSRYIEKRVDDMLELGMFEELAEYFGGIGPGRLDERGLNKAIGVPEFERYFRGRATYEEAVREVKDNSWELVKRQVEKIRRLREEAGWEMNRVDNTAALTAAVEGRDAAEIWEKQVLEPSLKIVKQFLME